MSSIQVVRRGHPRLFTCQKMSVFIPSEILKRFRLWWKGDSGVSFLSAGWTFLLSRWTTLGPSPKMLPRHPSLLYSQKQSPPGCPLSVDEFNSLMLESVFIWLLLLLLHAIVVWRASGARLPSSVDSGIERNLSVWFLFSSTPHTYLQTVRPSPFTF